MIEKELEMTDIGGPDRGLVPDGEDGEDTQEWPVSPADDPDAEPDEDWARDEPGPGR